MNTKHYSEVNSSNYDEIVCQIEMIGDCPDFEENLELQQEFERLENMIKEYDLIFYPRFNFISKK